MTARALLLALVAAMWAAALAHVIGARDTALVCLTVAVCWLVVRDRLADTRRQRHDADLDQAVDLGNSTVRPEHDAELRRILRGEGLR